MLGIEYRIQFIACGVYQNREKRTVRYSVEDLILTAEIGTIIARGSDPFVKIKIWRNLPQYEMISGQHIR